MKRKSTCICNKCEKEFEYTIQHEVIDENNGDVIQFFIICPNCGARFNSYVEDTKYRDMLTHYRKLTRAVKRGASSAKIKAAMNKMNNYEKNTMKPYYENLKAKYNNFGVNDNDKTANDN